MPMVQVTILQGRSIEQKRKAAKRITDALVEELGAKPDALVIAFNEVTRESFAVGGVLIADRK